MNLWMVVRLAVVVVSAVGACFSPLEPRAEPPIGWETLIVIFLFLAFGLVLVQLAMPVFSSKIASGIERSVS